MAGSRAVSLDCEMVVTATERDAVAQVCIVDDRLCTLLKTYVRPRCSVIDYRTPLSGINSQNLVGAPSLSEVVARVRPLLQGRILVGHSVRKDLRALGISHPERDIRDTSELPKFLDAGHRRRKLKDLVRLYLGRSIQQGAHCPEEDASAAMSLYLAQWDLPGMATPISELGEIGQFLFFSDDVQVHTQSTTRKCQDTLRLEGDMMSRNSIEFLDIM
eukprot:1194826-Prorocentrum_minimum.AAC.5